jgi:hypothetical protein
MSSTEHLTALQVEVAKTFFALEAARGYLVAGGAALVASDLVARSTEDIDLFASAPTATVLPARDALIQALEGHGHKVAILQSATTFCRVIVSGGGGELLVDLAIDSPPVAAPTLTILGPTLAPLELAGRKLLTLFGRAEARDFADVYVLAQRFGEAELLAQAAALDAGFDTTVLAQMMGTIDRFDPDEIPLVSAEVTPANAFFHSWAEELL